MKIVWLCLVCNTWDYEEELKEGSGLRNYPTIVEASALQRVASPKEGKSNSKPASVRDGGGSSVGSCKGSSVGAKPPLSSSANNNEEKSDVVSPCSPKDAHSTTSPTASGSQRQGTKTNSNTSRNIDTCKEHSRLTPTGYGSRMLRYCTICKEVRCMEQTVVRSIASAGPLSSSSSSCGSAEDKPDEDGEQQRQATIAEGQQDGECVREAREEEEKEEDEDEFVDRQRSTYRDPENDDYDKSESGSDVMEAVEEDLEDGRAQRGGRGERQMHMRGRPINSHSGYVQQATLLPELFNALSHYREMTSGYELSSLADLTDDDLAGVIASARHFVKILEDEALYRLNRERYHHETLQ